jgi:hypothetical protein
MKKDFNFLSQGAQTVAQEIITLLEITTDDVKASTKNRIILLTDLNRSKIFNQLEMMGYLRDHNIPGSSVGGYKTTNGIEIIIKPKSSQGSNSSGKQNESSFFNLINDIIQENGKPIDIILKNNHKLLKFYNIIRCIDSSTQGASKYDKADAQFIDNNNKVVGNISLKKRNAIRWESSKSRLIDGVDIFDNFIKKIFNNELQDLTLFPINESSSKYKLYNPTTQKILSKTIITNTPDDIMNEVVFGNDYPKTIVVKEDFEEFSNYKFVDNTLILSCHKIYDDISDIVNTPDEPVFAFSNHIGQRYGIEFRSFSKSALYDGENLRGSSLEIDFDCLK